MGDVAFFSRRMALFFAVVSAAGPTLAAVTLSNVTVSGNGGRGMRVRNPVTVTAHDLAVTGNHGGGLLVGAGRVDIDGASRINGNLGGAPVGYGAKAEANAVLTLIGTQATPIQVNGNTGVGLLLLGNFSGSFVEVATNGIQGVWVDTIDAPLFPEGGSPIRNALLAAFDVHGNGTNPGAYPPGGVTVLKTRTSTASTAERFQLTYVYSTSFFPSLVHDNLGDGVTLGGDSTPATGLCATLPQGVACGAVDAMVEDTVVSGNHQGIVVQEVDENASGTVPFLFGNTIKGNAEVGLHVRTSFVLRDPIYGIAINGNLIGHNGFPDSTCTSTEVASQVWFEGPVVASANAVSTCSAQASSVACFNVNVVDGFVCAWNENAAANKCRPAYPLNTQSCNDTNANRITGYHRSGSENPDFRVGVVVSNGAWVNAANVSWLTTAMDLDLDWTPIGVDSFVGNGGTTCPAAAITCPSP